MSNFIVREAKQAITAAAQLVNEHLADLIYEDPHIWSVKRCNTCRAASKLLGSPFGCVRYAKSKEKAKKKWYDDQQRRALIRKQQAAPDLQQQEH